MRFRFTIAGMLWFSVLIGLICVSARLIYRTEQTNRPDIEVSADGRTLVVPLGDGRLEIRDTQRLHSPQIISTKAQNNLERLAISPDGRRMAATDIWDQRELWVHDGESFKPQKLPAAPLDGPLIAISQDCRWLATHNKIRNEFSIWLLEEGKKQAACKLSGQGADSVLEAALDGERGWLIALWENGNVELLDVRGGQPQNLATEPGVYGDQVGLSPDGRWAAVTATNSSDHVNFVSLIDLSAPTRPVRRIASSAKGAAFSPDSTRLAVVKGFGARVELFELPAGTPVGTLGRPYIQTIAPAGPGRWLVSNRASVELWNEGEAVPLATLWRKSTIDELDWIVCILVFWLLVTVILRAARSIRRGGPGTHALSA